jgi:phage repressor protein C with HTH and peptisase S24 domain
LGFGYKKSLKVIQVKGDSMSPTFKENDLIMVDIEDTDITNGIFIFRCNDELYLKRLDKRPDGVLVISDNKIYPSYELPNGSEIIARVKSVFKYERI